MSPPQGLFSPIKVGSHELQHRVVLAPMTRFRATLKGQVPINPMMKTYYAQRASRPGTLLITEGTLVSPQAGGIDRIPGIWSTEQIDAWREVSSQL
jgi:NADPH2 dehydrogenase